VVRRTNVVGGKLSEASLAQGEGNKGGGKRKRTIISITQTMPDPKSGWIYPQEGKAWMGKIDLNNTNGGEDI